MSFIIGSGYHCRGQKDEDFTHIWYRNLREHTPFPKRIAIMSTGNYFPVAAKEINVFYGENIGHVEGVTGVTETSGWSAGVLALCLLAYNSNADLVYREQDALTFGPWVEQAYLDMGRASMVFGDAMKTAPWMPCAQSIFIIRHSFLLTFVKRFIALGNAPGLMPEHKFTQLAAQDETQFRRLTFGVDRERPLPWNNPIWYAQQWTQPELDELKSRALI